MAVLIKPSRKCSPPRSAMTSYLLAGMAAEAEAAEAAEAEAAEAEAEAEVEAAGRNSAWHFTKSLAARLPNWARSLVISASPLRGAAWTTR